MADSLSKLRRLDLTLLIVLLSLLRHRSATVVASELGLTQSAVSHALKRLRDVFGDELFLRKPHGFEPTAVALALEQPVAAAVDALKAALDGQAPFEPDAATGTVRIGAFDSEQVTLIPDLIRTLAAEAPGLRVAVQAIGRREAMEALSSATLDLAIGFFWNVDPNLIRQALYVEDYRVVGRGLVCSTDGTVDLDHYLGRDHILVSPAGDLRGIVDNLLAAKGVTRRVIAALPLFLPALATAAQTGAIATVPSRVARAHAAGFGLGIALPPLAIRDFPVSVIRHRRDEHNALLNWIVERLVRCCRQGQPMGSGA